MTRPASTGAAYHRATSYRRHGLTPHTLDWANQPVPVKPYPQLPRVPLDRDVTLPEIDYFGLVRSFGETGAPGGTELDRRALARILRLTHAVTARSMHAGRAFYYRSVASAGALYPCELYLGINRVQGVDQGLYYHDLFDASLVTLRRGRMPAMPEVERGAAATCFITAIFFRSAWKYRSRAYRYVLLDAGHLLENLRLALGALEIPFSIHLDFDDDAAAVMLGLDADREACLACVHLYDDGAGRPTGAAADPAPLGAAIQRASMVSDRDVGYAPILDLHRTARSLAATGGPCEAAPPGGMAAPSLAWTDLDPPDPTLAADYVHVLWRRRSRRNFIPAPLERQRFMTFINLMAASMQPDSGMPARCAAALTTNLLIGKDMPVAPGCYRLDAAVGRLGRTIDGPSIPSMAAACLDQMWLMHAGLHVLFLADLAALDRAWGGRGYRYAMLEAGRLGQQAYLAATALEWGACGVGAIYDQEAAELLRLTHDRALLYLVGVGAFKSR